MFEHLDDPHPPELGDGFRRAAVERGQRRRRHRRLAGTAGVTVASLLVGVGGLYGRVLWRADQIERVDVTSTGPVAAGDPVTVLVLGNDAPQGPGRTDTILLARLDPGAGTVALLSLPRDLMVDLPDGSGPVALNAVSANSGVAGVVAVVESHVGIPVDHLVQIDVEGFRSLVDEVGGIDVRVDVPVRDTSSGLVLDELGCVTLDGEQALALVRSRKVEVRDGTGAWLRDPLSDVSRVGTQRQVLVAALAALGDEGRDPVTLGRYVDWALENLVVDSALGRDDMVRLGRAIAGLDPSSVSSATLPVVPYPGNPNRLAADPAAAAATVGAFATGAPLPAPPVDGSGPGPGGLPGGEIVDPC